MRLLAPIHHPVSRLQLVLLGLVVATLLWTCAVLARTPAAIASIGLGVLWLFRFEWSTSSPVRLHSGALHQAKAYFARLDYSLLGVLPIAYGLSLLWAGDPSFTLKHIRITLTLLSVSGVLFVYRNHIAHYRQWAWWTLVAFASVGALGCIVYFYANETALIHLLGTGSAVPTPRAHVRTATLFAFAGLAATHLLAQRNPGFGLRVLAGLALLLNVLAIHVIAVRTGVVLLYLGISLYAVRWVINRLRSRQAVAAVLVLIACALLAATQLPSVQRKWAYTKYDFEQRHSPEALRYSDASRVISLEAALTIIQEDVLLGAHERGLREEMRAAYAKTGFAEAYLLPTNQYLFSWALCGVLGLLAVLAFFIAPMLETGWWRRPLLLEYLVLIALLCLVETPFANDVGVALSVLVVCFAKAGPVPNSTNRPRDA